MDDRRDIKYKQSAKGHVNGVWPTEITEGGYKGMLEALPAEAGELLSHFSGRYHLWELLFELVQPDVETFTIQHTGYSSCEQLSQNTLH